MINFFAIFVKVRKRIMIFTNIVLWAIEFRFGDTF